MHKDYGKRRLELALEQFEHKEDVENVFRSFQLGKMKEMMERLMKAYLVDSLDIGDHATLAGLAGEIGLNEKEALDALAGDWYSENIARDSADGSKIGIQGVPFFIVNNKYTISGAQSSEVFLELLQKIWNEDYDNAKTKENKSEPSSDEYCSDGTCKLD